LVPSLYLKPFSRYLDLNSECSQTDGQKEKSITIYLAVHSVHLADIIMQDLQLDETRWLMTCCHHGMHA